MRGIYLQSVLNKEIHFYVSVKTSYFQHSVYLAVTSFTMLASNANAVQFLLNMSDVHVATI